jgi:hypothetical protein
MSGPGLHCSVEDHKPVPVVVVVSKPFAYTPTSESAREPRMEAVMREDMGMGFFDSNSVSM